MKIAAYTSCSLNYLPKARVLAKTLKKHNPDASIVLCLSDIVPPGFSLDNELFDEIWFPDDLGYSLKWVFTHNVMELCTAVKGTALQKLMNSYDADIYCYFDPDVCIYHDISLIDKALGDASIGLTPHILAPEDTEVGVELTEKSVIEHGVYNLGFIAVRPDENGRQFADWWKYRLDKFCYDKRDFGMFTDQKWIDMVPAIFDNVAILKNTNFNVASWNIYHRKITYNKDEKRFEVDGEPLVFYHFSGTGPTGVHFRIRNVFDNGNGALAQVEKEYEEAIEQEGQSALEHYKFRYDYFDNGKKVTAAIRNFYYEHQDLQNAFPDPYKVSPDGSFYIWIKNNRPHFLDFFSIPSHRLENSFDALFREGYYLDRYPEVRQLVKSGKFSSALDHYCKLGSKLFYDPNEFFVSKYYFANAKFYDGAGMKHSGQEKENTLLWHYLSVGLENKIEPIEYFDSYWYMNTYKDLGEILRYGKFYSPLQHFLTKGDAEKRRPGPKLNMPEWLNNPFYLADVKKYKDITPFRSFIRWGFVEGRIRSID